MEKTYGYARVSTREQNLDRQIEALKQCGIDDRDIITDKASGKDLNRQGYQSLKNTMLRDGDTLIIKSLDRLSRKKEHIKGELEYYKAHHIRVQVIDLPTTMTKFPKGQEWISDMINNILIEVLSSMAEQERITIRQRQAEGIAAAQAKGKHLGRPTAAYPDNWDSVYKQWKDGHITAKKAMELLNMKRTTFYKLAKQYNSTNS
jgi:DNA invertase Pin-like site-specific DNA recombinase